MNDPLSQPPSDAELERMLRGRFRRTSPEFEQRWRELRAGFAAPPRPQPPSWTRWLLWPGLASAAMAALIFALFFHSPVPPARGGASVSFEELIALNEALQPATPLLDPETRDALLNLPSGSHL